MISDVDENMSGSIDFGEFLKVVQGAKQRVSGQSDDEEILDAFVACGGKPDKTGHVRKDNLVKIIKNDFGLNINIEELINKVDGSGSGNINFSDFQLLLSS